MGPLYSSPLAAVKEYRRGRVIELRLEPAAPLGYHERSEDSRLDPVAGGLAGVRERIRAACARAGRDPAEVLLVAVTKTVGRGAIERALAAGVPALGESRVQEAQLKIETLGRPVPWHLIGHLQTNKARLAVRLFDVIHSVDSERLIRALGEEAERAGVEIDVLLQVNLAGEQAKSGCRPEAAAGLAAQVLDQPRLGLRGLMTIPPYDPDPERSRPFFRALRELRGELAHSLPEPAAAELSMGMSDDFEVAIEEGATMVRVGTAIFGERS